MQAAANDSGSSAAITPTLPKAAPPAPLLAAELFRTHRQRHLQSRRASRGLLILETPSPPRGLLILRDARAGAGAPRDE